jgi:hypothetical protein
MLPHTCTYIYINSPRRIGERVPCRLRDADGRGQEESDDEDGKEGGEDEDEGEEEEEDEDGDEEGDDDAAKV